MKDLVLSLYVNENLSINEISSRLNCRKEDALNILKNNHYLIANGRTRERVLSLKLAIDEYLNLNKQVGATTIAKKYKIPHTCLIDALHSIGETVPNNQNATKFNEDIFTIIDTEEKAYWLGFIFADGCISSSPLNPYQKTRYNFELSLSVKDREHLLKFNTFMSYNGNNLKEKSVKLGENVYDCVRWSIVNKKLWNSLNDLGCTPNKSLTLAFPYSVFTDDNLVRHFIRGYFDGDGSLGIYNNGKICQCSCLGTKHMLDGIMQFSGFQNVKYHHDNRHSDNTYSFEFTANKALKFLKYIYEDSTIYLNRKYQKYLEICRLLEKSSKLSEDNNGEGCDANTVIT